MCHVIYIFFGSSFWSLLVLEYEETQNFGCIYHKQSWDNKFFLKNSEFTVYVLATMMKGSHLTCFLWKIGAPAFMKKYSISGNSNEESLQGKVSLWIGLCSMLRNKHPLSH